MRDGKTEIIERPSSTDDLQMREFLTSHEAKIVVVAGANAGMEYALESERVTLGRGPNVDIAMKDPAMSRQHAAIDYSGEGFRIQDLGSTNGLRLDEQPVETGTLTNGCRFEIGGHLFQFVVEEREQEPDVYELPSGV